MSDTQERTGSCLCKAVRFNAKTSHNNIHVCHCSMCLQWGGSPLMATDCDSQVSFQGSKNISVFNSSDWAERGFCQHCGSHLFYRLKQNQQYFIPVGLFDDTNGLILKQQLFIDKKPTFYEFANPTNNLTEAEVFAHFSS